MLLKPEEFEENILKRAFSNTVGSGESRDFSAEVSSSKNIKRPVIVAFLNSSGVYCGRPGLSFLGS